MNVQRIPVPVAGTDFLTSAAAWLANQKGVPAAPAGPTRFLLNDRDPAEWVHRDLPYQGGLYAAQFLLGLGSPALNPGNPYEALANQGGFVNFGGPHVLSMVAKLADEALNATWYQKWLVHRRLRPEEFAGRVHHHLSGAASVPMHPLAAALVRVRDADRVGGMPLPETERLRPALAVDVHLEDLGVHRHQGTVGKRQAQADRIEGTRQRHVSRSSGKRDGVSPSTGRAGKGSEGSGRLSELGVESS
jgi:hypothetical protein